MLEKSEEWKEWMQKVDPSATGHGALPGKC